MSTDYLKAENRAATRAAIMAELKAHPGRSDLRIAEAAGCSKGTVRRVRLEMGAPQEPVIWTRQPVGPQEHIQARKDMRLTSAEELLALGRDTDPYYTGTPAHWRQAEWFRGLWDQFGFGQGVHLRRIHYTISQSGVLRPGGDPYLNNSECWNQLKVASKAARVLDLVDAELMIDRRSEPVAVQVDPRIDPVSGPDAEVDEPSLYVPSLTLPRVDLHLPSVQIDGYEYSPADQPVLLEVWVEKSTQNDILVPLCRELDLNLKVGRGTESIPSAIGLLRRAEAIGRSIHVLYISDLDSEGEVMPVIVARYAQFYGEKFGIEQRVTLERLALIASQVEEYSLPKSPDKDETELDALEALYPGELERIVREAVAPWRDPDLENLLEEAEDEAHEAADAAWAEASEDLATEAGELGTQAQTIIDSLAPAIVEASRRLEPLRQQASQLEDRIRDAAGEVEFELPERPDPEDPEVDTTGMLYDSDRDWLDQVAAWQAAKARAA